ncbi:MAG: hypothetical protein WCK34_15420, partial [Bacteroidota bacterium]
HTSFSRSESPPDPCWIFANPVFVHEQGEPPDESTRDKLTRMTSSYAGLWRKFLVDLEDELRCYTFISDYLPLITGENSQAAEAGKIPVRSTVEEIAVIARLFYEARLINLNKSRFCQLLAGAFSTPRQQNISGGSLKNHFDTPAPETVDRINALLCKMQKISRILARQK